MKEFGILTLDDKGCVFQNDTAINRICSFDEADINLQKTLVKLSGKKVGTRRTQPPAQAGQSTDPTKTTLLAGSKGNRCPLPPLIIFSKATYGPDIAANMPMLRESVHRVASLWQRQRGHDTRPLQDVAADGNRHVHPRRLGKGSHNLM